MSALYRLPYNSRFLIIQINDCSILRIIRDTLTYRTIFFNYQHTFHPAYFCPYFIRITDVTHCLHTFCRHLVFSAKSFIQCTQRFCYMALCQLFPCKCDHLFSVIQIQISCLLLMDHKTRIQIRSLLIIQSIPMHKI